MHFTVEHTNRASLAKFRQLYQLVKKKISDLRKEKEIGPYNQTLNEKVTAGTLDLMGFLTNFKSQLAHIEEEMMICLTLLSMD